MDEKDAESAKYYTKARRPPPAARRPPPASRRESCHRPLAARFTAARCAPSGGPDARPLVSVWQVMTKAAKDAEFVSKEVTRLTKMMDDGSVKADKKTQFGRRLNMLSSFE